MDICHIYDYEIQARKGAKEYTRENCESIKRVVFNALRYTIWTEDGNIHHFMGGERYSQWCKGRTYMLSDGTVMHSDYPIAEQLKEGAEHD